MIYLVMYAYYSDWEIYGYFTNREDAEKYVVKYPEKDLFIKEVSSFDNKEDLRGIKVRYEKPIIFQKDINSWSCLDSGDPILYQSQFARSNHIEYSRFDWVRVWVNTEKNDIDLQMKIAQDIFYQFLESCDGNITKKAIGEFNKILSAEEDARKEAEKQEKIKKKELAELKRLKEKYEQ